MEVMGTKHAQIQREFKGRCSDSFRAKDEAKTFPAFIESACTSACVECVDASD